MAIVSAAHTIGKSKTNEDASFMIDRGFGVADGVSGWNDFGFSSEAFSHELMDNCKKEIESFERQSAERMQGKTKYKKMRKRRSFMSLE